MKNSEYQEIGELFREARNNGLADKLIRDDSGVRIGIGRVTYQVGDRYAAAFLRGVLRQVPTVRRRKVA